MPEPCGLETSLADWAVDHPEIVPLMERMGLDYTCGGRSLEWACLRCGLNPTMVLREFDEQLGICRDQPGPLTPFSAKYGNTSDRPRPAC